MNSGLFWWPAAPSLVAAILAYLGILFVGLGTILAAYRSEGTPSAFNPYASRRRNASDEQAPSLKAFIETAMQRAGR